MYDCLVDLIGITKSDCACDVAGLTGDLAADWYKKSTSDLFLDELEGIVPLQAAGQSAACTNEMATFYARAKESAIKQMADDVIIGLTARGVNGIKTYTGKIAGVGAGSIVDVSVFDKAGLKLSTVPMKGGVINISKITTIMSADATFDIDIYKQEAGSETLQFIKTITGIQSLASGAYENVLTGNNLISLQLSEYGCDYYFLYAATINPKGNSLSCGCGNIEYVLREYLTVAGVAGEETSDDYVFSSFNNAMGLSFDAVIGCDTTTIICEAFYNDVPAKLIMAYASRFKGGELVHEFVSKSGNINRYTMTSQESIWGKRNHFRSEYNTRINWLVENIDLNLIDCYICNDNRVKKGGILA